MTIVDELLRIILPNSAAVFFSARPIKTSKLRMAVALKNATPTCRPRVVGGIIQGCQIRNVCIQRFAIGLQTF
ncbi:MAG: hypothetical protein AAF220_09045, partial [Pseudomonadota bacterium]